MDLKPIPTSGLTLSRLNESTTVESLILEVGEHVVREIQLWFGAPMTDIYLVAFVQYNGPHEEAAETDHVVGRAEKVRPEDRRGPPERNERG